MEAKKKSKVGPRGPVSYLFVSIVQVERSRRGRVRLLLDGDHRDLTADSANRGSLWAFSSASNVTSLSDGGLSSGAAVFKAVQHCPLVFCIVKGLKEA